MIATLSAIEMPAPAPDTGGQWVHLVPNGSFRGKDGRGPWEAVDLSSIIAASLLQAVGRSIPVDYDHQIDLATSKGGQAPAAGWIVNMQARPNGIWGLVEWTPRAQAALAGREYRFLSPVIAHEPAGKVTAILRASLTNSPNLPQLAALNSAGMPMLTDEMMSTLMGLLGLPEGSEPMDIVEAVRALTTAKNSTDPAKFVPIELFQEAVRIANSANAGISRQSAEIAVSQAEHDRKVMPFMREWAVSLCMTNKPAFDAFLKTTGPSINSFLGVLTSPARPPFEGGWVDPQAQGETAPADAVLAKLGLTTDDVKKYGARPV